jgi:hypothetical protein
MEALPGISLHSSKGLRGVQGFTYQKWSLKRSVFNSLLAVLHSDLSRAFVSVSPQCSTWQEVSPTRTRLVSIAGDKALLARGLDHNILSFLLHVHVMLILAG